MPLLLCPNCNASMQNVARSGVELDMCPGCRGVWLDRGELEKLLGAGRETAQDDGVEEICVIGGTAVFEAALPRARRLYITEVEASPEGDAVFPAFDPAAWVEVSAEHHPAGEKDDHAFTFRVLERL